jgi:magnesium transporter
MASEIDLKKETLEQLITRGDAELLKDTLSQWPREDTGYVASQLEEPDFIRLAELLADSHSEVAATLFERLPDTRSARIMNRMDTDAAALILQALPSNDRADVFQSMETGRAERILNTLPPSDARRIEHLIAYEKTSAGGLMIDEFITHSATNNVRDIVIDLRRRAEDYARFDVQYVYLTDAMGRLEGVVRLRDLLLTPDERPLREIMIPAPARVCVLDTQEQLESFFDAYSFFAAPVVTEEGVLVGVVRRAAVEEARAEEADRTLLAFGGIVGGEELRAMPTGQRMARRLAFLCPNILLNLLAASIIAVYEPTIAAVTALAIFLPMLSDMSGCAGNQAVAVSIRELSLGLLKPRDALHALRKELVIGCANGLILGTLIGGISWVMRGDQYPLIGVVVGGAMCINSVVAVSVGGTVPLLMKRIGVDPALAASPILTTFTDMCGFFLTLSFATLLLL